MSDAKKDLLAAELGEAAEVFLGKVMCADTETKIQTDGHSMILRLSQFAFQEINARHVTVEDRYKGVLEELIASARAMKEAIATKEPEEFGIVASDEHWFIRDELIGRADKALAAAEKLFEIAEIDQERIVGEGKKTRLSPHGRERLREFLQRVTKWEDQSWPDEKLEEMFKMADPSVYGPTEFVQLKVGASVTKSGEDEFFLIQPNMVIFER